jgi:putative FmdB family regulatory protein
MPIYEYRCSHCGHELEALQKISDPALTDCPSCRNAALTKLVSAAGFQLKGSGWYATDFRGSAKPSPKANGDGAESKAETKPASTTESKGEAASAAPAAGCGGGCACH